MEKKTRRLKVPVLESKASDWVDLQHKLQKFLDDGSDSYDLFVPENPEGEFNILVTYKYADGELLDWDKIKKEL